MQVQVLVGQQVPECGDSLFVPGTLHQVVCLVFPPGGRALRNHLQDLPAVFLPCPGIDVPIRGRLGITASRIVQPHLHLVVFQQGPGRDAVRLQGVHHVERLLVQAGGDQAERRGAAGFHPGVRQFRRGCQPGHLLRVRIGRIILVTLVFLIQFPRHPVAFPVVQRRTDPAAQLPDPGLFPRVILCLFRQLCVQFIQPRLPFPPLQGQKHEHQRDEGKPFFHHATR